jgi:hypothetical protein
VPCSRTSGLHLTLRGLREHKGLDVTTCRGSQTPRLWFVHRAHLLIPIPFSVSRISLDPFHEFLEWFAPYSNSEISQIPHPRSSLTDPLQLFHPSQQSLSESLGTGPKIFQRPRGTAEFAQLMTCSPQSRDGSIATMPKTPDTTPSAIPPDRTLANSLPGTIGTGQERDLCICVTPTTFRILHGPLEAGCLGQSGEVLSSLTRVTCVEAFQKSPTTQLHRNTTAH